MKRRTQSTGAAKSRKRVKIEYEKTPPEHWKEVYDGIAEMRAKTKAPVDTMGCATQWDKEVDAKTSRYQTLVNLMLSSQTKDEVNAEAMKKLIAHGLTPENMVKTSDADLDKMIFSVGFHNRKVKYIKATSQLLLDKYNGDIPQTVEEMCELPGVGKKMAFLLMTHAWNKYVPLVNEYNSLRPMGIGVDVHVHRICERLGWVKESKNPEETRLALEAWLPKEYWGKEGINKLLVGFGQTVCKPVKPNCQNCTVSHLCPSAFKAEKEKKAKTEKRKSDEETKKPRNRKSKK